jgi:hypothetical protein
VAKSSASEVFKVDPWVHHLGGLVSRYPRLFVRLGNLESRLLADQVEALQIDRPVYVTGLARAGSTLLLELLGWHPDVVTHRYRDYPMLHVPWLWNRFLDRVPRRDAAAAERSHRDGIVVDSESPEAFEEVLWMTFFPRLHDVSRSAVLDSATRNATFESFYRDHIRKLLLLRGGSRYVAKGNYNTTRLEYLLTLFDDARFVVPIRDPVWHIASLMKQHRLFCAGQQENPRALTHLQRVGHFEFGLDRRPVNVGNSPAAQRIGRLWTNGSEVEGWARYWSDLYGHVADRLVANERLRKAALVVHYEALCSEPRETLAAVFHHCGLAATPELLERAAARVRFPTYYAPRFTAEERDIITKCTAETAARFGSGRPANDQWPALEAG